MLNKIPPQSIETEESILSKILLFPDSNMIEALTPEDFYKTSHQIIFKACFDLHKKKQNIDLVTVADSLKDIKGIGSQLAQITEAPVATNTEQYVLKLKGYRALRNLIFKSQQIIDSCFITDDPMETLDKAQSEINHIEIEGSKETFQAMPEAMEEAYNRYEALNTGKKGLSIRTGYKELDYVLGGLRGSKLITLAGRPAMGKTAFMLNLARQISDKVGIFSLEMDKEELIDRLICIESKVNTMRLTGTGPDSEDWRKLNNGMSILNNRQIIIDDTPASIMELKRRARLLKKMGCKIIFIDQLSKIKGDRTIKRFERISEQVNLLADLKKELRMPIVLLAQLNREVDKRNTKLPQLSDLKDTGSLEEDSDIVIFVHRAYEYNKDQELKKKAQIFVAKQRGGPTRIIESIGWDGKYTEFYDTH